MFFFLEYQNAEIFEDWILSESRTSELRKRLGALHHGLDIIMFYTYQC